MAIITKEDVIKLAKMSQISISDKETEDLTKRIETLLEYVSCLGEISKNHKLSELSNRNVNVLRQDIVLKTDDKPILKLAPDSQDNYFVVPTIIKN